MSVDTPDHLLVPPTSNHGAGSVRAARLARRSLLEVTVLAALFLAYNAGRLAVQGQEAAARQNAAVVRRLESALPLPSEAWLQGVLTGTPQLLELANQYYVSLHFPVMVAFLGWGFLCRPRGDYLWARNLLVLLTFSALVLHVAVPLAPPRMFPEWGYVDTMATWGPSAYDGASAALANQYAAMPSLHIGWALLIAFVLTRTGPRPLAVVAVLHAAITVFVVVITANHWWLDGIIAGALLLMALVIYPRPAATRLPSLGGVARGWRRFTSRSPRHDT